MKEIDNELNEVSGGKQTAAGKEMLYCSACKYTVDPVKAPITILPGEMYECPKCHQVAMTLKKI